MPDRQMTVLAAFGTIFLRNTEACACASAYGIKCVGRIVTKSMSKICNFWRLIVGDCDYAES